MSAIRTLFVDDSRDDVLVLLRDLRAADLAIAATHVDSIQDLERELLTREWDIILSDYAMQVLDLPVVMDLQARLAPLVPVVLVTGAIGDEAVADVMRRGVSDVVRKGGFSQRLGFVVRREVSRARSNRRTVQRQRRTERVLDIFNAANDWRSAIQDTLAYLATSFGCGSALMSEAAETSELLTPIGVWTNSKFTEIGSMAYNVPQPLRGTMAALCLQSGLQEYHPDLSQVPVEKQSSRLRQTIAVGGRSLLCQPILSNGRRFVLSMLFDDSTVVNDNAKQDIQAIVSALQPALFRRISESERALLISALNAACNGVLITEAYPLNGSSPRIVYSNRAISEVSSETLEDLLGTAPRVSPERSTSPAARDAVQQGMVAGEPVSVEIMNHRVDGSPFWTALDITPVHDDGHLTHFVAIQTDITKQRAAEQERKEREAFRLMFENNPIPMWVYDIATERFLEVNSAAIRRFGWTHAEFMARSLGEVRGDLDPAEPGTDAGCEASDDAGVLHFTASGETAVFRTSSSRIDHKGAKACLAVLWDMTDIERARDALFRNNAELAALTEVLQNRTADLESAAHLARIGTWRIRYDTREVTWSPETFAILGRDPATYELQPCNILSCVHPDDVEMFRGYGRRARVAGGKQEVEYRIIRPNGEIRVIHEVCRSVHEACGTLVGTAGVMQDVTEQHMAKAALLRSEKLKAIGQITGGIAHDFNNLLTVIGLNLEAVLDSDELAEPLRAMLEPALHATTRSAALTGQLLSYGRRQSLAPEITDLQSLVETALPLFERAVGGCGQLILAPRSTRSCTTIDQADFENSVMNLVINARDALSGRSGPQTILLSITEATIATALEVMPDTVPAGSYLCVRVEDTGCGIPADTVGRILEPFFTTKPIGSGSGLGLSMVYGFVRQSNGFVVIASEPGVGTRVSLYFPIMQGEKAGRSPANPAERILQDHHHVLLVEDGDALRRTLHRLFTDLGFDTVSVGTAHEALDELATNRRFDLLLSDVALPGDLDGIRLAEAAKTLRPGLKIVLMSGHVPDGSGQKNEWKLLRKPFTIAALSDALAGG